MAVIVPLHGGQIGRVKPSPEDSHTAAMRSSSPFHRVKRKLPFAGRGICSGGDRRGFAPDTASNGEAGRPREVLPCCDLGLHLLKLLPNETQGVFPKKETSRRLRCFHQP